MLVVCGAAKPVAAMRATASQDSRSTRRASCAGRCDAGSPAPRRARRRPSATARAPRGRRRAGAPASSEPARSKPRRSPTRISPPQTVPSGPWPAPSKIAPTAGPASPCSARHAARCAWWCCTAIVRDALALERVASSTGSRDAGRGRRPAGATANSRSKCAMPSRKARSVSAVAQVADVVADPRAVALGEAEGALELGAAGEQRARGAGTGSRDARRDVPARAAHARSGRAAHGAHDGVVGAGVDRAVVDRKASAIAAQALAARRRRGRRSARRRRCRSSSPAGRRRRRAAGGAAACRAASRRARASRARRRSATAASARRRRQHDRPRGATAAAAPRRRPSSTSARPPRRSAAMQRERRSSRCLRARSARTAALVVGAAGEVVAAEPLDRDDRARVEQLRCAGRPRRRAVVSTALAVGVHEPGLRAARRARVRLRVEAPVRRVLVLGPARGAHLERRPSSCAAGRRGRRARS